MNCNINKKEECRRLWKEVFGDSDEFIASFINLFYNEENMLCIEQDGKMLSMLHIIPFELNGSKVAYIYAVATDADARGQGYATKLIKQAIEKAQVEGYKAIFTLPADDMLRSFYSQFGFKGIYTIKFETKEHFDFGTGEEEKDIAMAIILDNRLILPEVIVLKEI
jgi:predicted acetyltransferase